MNEQDPDTQLDAELRALGLPAEAEPVASPPAVLAASGWRPPLGLSGPRLWTAIGGSAFLGASLHALLTGVLLPEPTVVTVERRVEVPVERVVEVPRDVFIDREIVREVVRYIRVPVQAVPVGDLNLGALATEEDGAFEPLRWPEPDANQDGAQAVDAAVDEALGGGEAGPVVEAPERGESPEDPGQTEDDRDGIDGQWSIKGGAGFALVPLPERREASRDMLALVRVGGDWRLDDRTFSPLIGVIGEIGVGTPDMRMELVPAARGELGLSLQGSRVGLDLSGTAGVHGRGETPLGEPRVEPQVGLVSGFGFGTTRVELTALRSMTTTAPWSLGLTVGGRWGVGG